MFYHIFRSIPVSWPQIGPMIALLCLEKFTPKWIDTSMKSIHIKICIDFENIIGFQRSCKTWFLEAGLSQMRLRRSAPCIDYPVLTLRA